MGILDKAKSAAKSTKLKGEIALLDRDMKARKQKFGIEVCDLLMAMESKENMGVASSGSIFLNVESAMRGPFSSVKGDVLELQGKKDDIQQRIDAAGELKRSPAGEEASAMDKAKAAGTDTKRKTKLALLDREIKARKEKFGLEVYDTAVGVVVANAQFSRGGRTLNDTKNQGADSMKQAISKTEKMSFVEKEIAKAAVKKVSKGLTQFTVSDQDITACIEKVKAEVEEKQSKKDRKLKEIEELK